MKSLIQVITAMIILLPLLLGCSQRASGQGSAENLFEAIETPEKLSAAQSKTLRGLRNQTGVVRVAVVRLRYDLAQRTKPGAKVVLTLFPGTEVELSFRSLERRADKDYTWNGGDPSSGQHATLVVAGEDVIGTVRSGGKLYQIRPIGDGLHSIAKVDESRLIDEPPG